ncbi:MAG: DNA cytosine methyltransferase [Candidatus Velthaea sp.]
MLREALDGKTPDVLVGGAPCQGFSLCNRKQFDEDPRNLLFKEYMRIVELTKPRFVLFENVRTIKAAGDGSFVRAIEEHFEELGYAVRSGPAKAVDFAVPQSRIRWIFFGMLGSTPPPWPLGSRRSSSPLTVFDAIGDLPELENDSVATEYDKPAKTPYQIAMRGDMTRLLNHGSPNHPQETIDRIGRTEPGKPMYDSFRQRIRLKWDMPSPTQVCGGIRPQFQFGHPQQPRGLSVRERARIQSFPDSYEFTGGLVMGRVQTGNAVPPRLAEAFGHVIMEMITGVKRIDSFSKVEDSRELSFSFV